MAISLTLRGGKGSPLTSTELDNNIQTLVDHADGIQHTPTVVSDKLNTSTGYFALPSGTTAQRPLSPNAGYIRFNTTIGLAEYYDGEIWKAIDSPPVLTNISPTSYNSDDSAGSVTFTVSGANFQVGVVITLIGASGAVYSVTTTRVSSTTLTFDLTQGMLDAADDDYAVKITNPSTLSVTSENIIVQGMDPVWGSLSGSIGTFKDNLAVEAQSIPNVGLTVGEADAVVTHAITSGSIPSGVSLNSSTGSLTGDPTDISSDTTYNFTVTASAYDTSKDASNTYIRSFSLILESTSDGSSSAKAATTAAELYEDGAASGTKWILIGSTPYQVTYEATDKFGTGDFGWAVVTGEFYGTNTSLRSGGQVGTYVDYAFYSNGFRLGDPVNSTTSLSEMAWVDLKLPDLQKAKITQMTGYSEGTSDADDGTTWDPADGGGFSAVLSNWAVNTSPTQSNPEGYVWTIWNNSSSATWANGGIRVIKKGDEFGNQFYHATTRVLTESDFTLQSFPSTVNNPTMRAFTGDSGPESVRFSNWKIWVH
jgi:hypothetical protein